MRGTSLLMVGFLAHIGLILPITAYPLTQDTCPRFTLLLHKPLENKLCALLNRPSSQFNPQEVNQVIDELGPSPTFTRTCATSSEAFPLCLSLGLHYPILTRLAQIGYEGPNATDANGIPLYYYVLGDTRAENRLSRLAVSLNHTLAYLMDLLRPAALIIIPQIVLLPSRT